MGGNNLIYAKAINRIIVVLLTLIIPFVTIALAANIMTRLPDIYAFEFTRSQVTEAAELTAKPADIAALFSAYLNGKTDEFQLVAEYQGREQQVFTMKDQIGMHNVQKMINGLLLSAIISLLVGVLLIYIALKRYEKELVRTAYKYSVALYGLFWIGLFIASASGTITQIMQTLIFISGFDVDSLLGMLLSGSFFSVWFTFTFIGSAVILFILGNIIWKYTKERRMFVY